jgi:AraC family transcriptional regulator
MISPNISVSSEKKLIGMRLKMSFANYKAPQLWGSFMLRRTEIRSRVGNDYYSLALFAPDHFSKFNSDREFDRLAAMEVSDFNNIPEGMEAFVLEKGLYAVFQHKGNGSKASETFKHIFYSWLPNSGYELDDRPHFEILGEKYKKDSPDSAEELWIPIKKN